MNRRRDTLREREERIHCRVFRLFIEGRRRKGAESLATHLFIAETEKGGRKGREEATETISRVLYLNEEKGRGEKRDKLF